MLLVRIVSWWKALIIGSAVVLAAGCSTLGVAYSNGPTLAWWWADGWFDFDRSQSPAVRSALDRWFAWHRDTQIEPTVALLREAQRAVQGDTTPEAVCRWNARMREQFEPSLDRALAEAAALVPQLKAAQFAALERRYAKEQAEDREELLQADPAERRIQSLDRARKRFERVYGQLAEAQLRVIEAGLAASPFDPERFVAERARRQQQTLATLRRLAAEPGTPESRLAALKALYNENMGSSPDPAYRALQQRLTAHNCEMVARLHNATTPRQRAHAADAIGGWADDLGAVRGNPRVPGPQET